MYLGRARGWGVNGPWPNAADDIVALTTSTAADTPERDACLFGGSGSLAVLADGRFTGPLSGRDRFGPYLGGVHVYGDWSEAKSRVHRETLDKVLGVDTLPYGTVCLYTVLTRRIIEEMVALFASPPAGQRSQVR